MKYQNKYYSEKTPYEEDENLCHSYQPQKVYHHRHIVSEADKYRHSKMTKKGKWRDHRGYLDSIQENKWT